MFATLLLAGGIALALAADVLTVAVFDVESKDEAKRDLGSEVAALVNVHLSAEPQLITVERAEMRMLPIGNTVASAWAAVSCNRIWQKQ